MMQDMARLRLAIYRSFHELAEVQRFDEAFCRVRAQQVRIIQRRAAPPPDAERASPISILSFCKTHPNASNLHHFQDHYCR